MTQDRRSSERRGLGRGLSALMADVGLAPQVPENAPEPVGLRAELRIATDRIAPNPNQPRRRFAEEALAELAESIRRRGVLQPIIVRPRPDGGYEIVAGERRWRAAQMAQQHDVPVIVRELDDAATLEVAIIENVQRADLNAIEEAEGYAQLIERFGHTQEQVADALSRSRSHVANLLRLLKLPEVVQAHVREGRLTAGHARARVTMKSPRSAAEEIISKGLSVRQAEAMARDEASGIMLRPRRAGDTGRRPPEKDADTRAIEADLAANLGMGVSIHHEPGGSRGRLTITYNTLEELDDLCRALSGMQRGEHF
ncbi:MAG TPA: ParB/RepB/Spo0J family partition protein [Paracoccaceae bacterium]|nr:ParB/RepB/Spo0J family partition protein [Paracoccaceae bacterium]